MRDGPDIAALFRFRYLVANAHLVRTGHASSFSEELRHGRMAFNQVARNADKERKSSKPITLNSWLGLCPSKQYVALLAVASAARSATLEEVQQEDVWYTNKFMIVSALGSLLFLLCHAILGFRVRCRFLTQFSPHR